MKLQYLGDSRDAFKWDFLHWLCTQSSPNFNQLHVVPLLTPDANNNEGNTPHHRFNCRPYIRTFLDRLKTEKTLSNIPELGSISSENSLFDVRVFGDDTRHIESGANRINYWKGFDSSSFGNSVIFFDPDNGFETKTQKSTKWIRHSELKDFLGKMSDDSVVVVYQHRPRKTWDDVFKILKDVITYASSTFAVYESNLAFVLLTKSPITSSRVKSALEQYSQLENNVHFREIV